MQVGGLSRRCVVMPLLLKLEHFEDISAAILYAYFWLVAVRISIFSVIVISVLPERYGRFSE